MADEITIAESLSFQKIINLSDGGQNSIYIPITNGDNSGADQNHPDHYRFDIMAPELGQIIDHINEAKKPGGVNNFVTMVLRSRNIEISGNGAAKCSEPGSSGKILLNLPNGGNVWEGAGTFDFYVLRLCYLMKLKISTFNGNVVASGDFGSSIRPYLLEFLPTSISGSLMMDGTGTANLTVEEVAKSFWSDGVDFDWTPKLIGSTNEWMMIHGSKQIPNLTGTRINGNLLIQDSTVNDQLLPSKVQGHCLINFCQLGEVAKLPSTGGNLDLSGNPNLSFGSAVRKTEVKENLVIPAEMMKDKLNTEESIKKIIDVSGDVLSVENSKVKKFPKTKKPNPNSLGNLAMDFIREFFGELGTAVVRKTGDLIKKTANAIIGKSPIVKPPEK